jgi:hypothetical protein
MRPNDQQHLGGWMEIDRRAFTAGRRGTAALHPHRRARVVIDRAFGRPFLRRGLVGVLVIAVLTMPAAAQQAPASEDAPTAAAIPPSRFEGTWVGTQAWAIDNPPPGSSQDQAVTLEIEVVEGKITGTMTPFLGGEDGATFVDARIVGEELHATAVVGRPRPQAAGRRGGGFKEATRIAFVFRNAGVNMNGTADVRMGDVPWMKFRYELGKKRSRY